jgi:hypothetical protein
MSAVKVAADAPIGRSLELTRRGLVDFSRTGDDDCWRLRRLRRRGEMRDEQIMDLSADELHAMRSVLGAATSRDGRGP